MSRRAVFRPRNRWRKARQLLFILGDQLSREHPGLAALDRSRDVVFMCEVREEAEHVPSHVQRTTLFLSAMRHHAQWLTARNFRVRYITLDDPRNTQSLSQELARAIDCLAPDVVLCMQAGEHRIAEALKKTCSAAEVSLQTLEDTSFSCSLSEFDAWAEGRNELTMEYFYRERRRKLSLLIADDGKPAGGEWNYDSENRKTFKAAPACPRPYRARPDAMTREVMELVGSTWPDAYGRLEHFHWPVSREEALRALDDFVSKRLSEFGPFEDAMWSGEAFLYHSLLSSSLNLKLITPMECIEKARAAYEGGKVPLNSIEGFVRQIVGWREFMRGIYYREGPAYVSCNELAQAGQLPRWYWTSDTDMNCLAHCLGEVIEHGYSHHIPRLMVIGNFALIAGIEPGRIHGWFLAMYVDAIEWVTAPNVVGMSQHADGGVVGSKPYAASGKYIQRMSNYCGECAYDVRKRSGDQACPFNVFYWDFLIRHRGRLESNHRMRMILRNLDKMDEDTIRIISEQANALRRQFGID